MSELRHWSEEGATAGERALLEVSRSEHASASARARALAALGVATVVTTTATSATATVATKAGAGVLVKLASLSLLAGSVIAGGIVVRNVRLASSRSAALASNPVVTAPIDPKPQTVEPPQSLSPVPTPPLVAAPAPPLRAVTPIRSSRPSAPDERLSQEVVALERAHRALAAHDADAALQMLDRYRSQFPGGALSSDATVLRVQALLAKGNIAGAQALADAYSSAHPDSPYARRIEDLVRAEQKE